MLLVLVMVMLVVATLVVVADLVVVVIDTAVAVKRIERIDEKTNHPAVFIVSLNRTFMV